MNVLISLFDITGAWSKNYEEAGYRVIKIDIKNGRDILTWDYKKEIPQASVVGVLAAPPCTDFTNSCSRLWSAKDESGATEKSKKLVLKTLEIINYFADGKPGFFWALENPAGRIQKLFPELGRGWFWDPWQFGDPWTKKTGIWGKFNKPKKNIVDPFKWTAQGSWTQSFGGLRGKTKAVRSVTPPGFSRAFFDANNPLNLELGEHIYFFGRCKYGMWSCAFRVSSEMCNICEDGDNYEPDEVAENFESEEDFFKHLFAGGGGILKPGNVNPVQLKFFSEGDEEITKRL